jgi:nitrogenase molybdenum-iron protein alpha/beta subunit
MSGYSESITPDSLSGIIFALEGVAGSIVLLNGPTGCKFYHSSLSDNQMIRQLEFDPLNYPEKWYFGQPRVPCTYLDSSDYVYGSREKLIEALEYIRDNTRHSLIAIVNSPGAALIGDDIKGIVRPALGDAAAVIIETPSFSSDICAGYETGVLALLEALNPPMLLVRPKTVNLLGISIFQKYFAGDALELRRLLELCGITVTCSLCAGSPLEMVREISAATVNVIVRPEYGVGTAEYLEERYGTPYYICEGATIGFSATEKFIYDLCDMLGGDPAPAIEDSERARADAYVHISRVNSLTGLPKGARVSVEGTYSDVYAYFRFFAEYFGMLPEAAAVFCPRADLMKPKLEEFMRGHNLSDVLARDIYDAQSELVFASGMTISRLRNAGKIFVGIENALPGLGYLDVMPKTHLGVSGALLLVEQVLNGLLL